MQSRHNKILLRANIFTFSDTSSYTTQNPFFKGKMYKQSRKMFQTINYPLGSKSLIGKWRACAMPTQYFDASQVNNLSHIS